MKKPISEQVVVITGASSGIGRECALQFARRGAKVVAAARNQTALRALASTAEAAKGQIMLMDVDVADAEQVEGLARATVERFGRIDTWVNNAAVIMYATVAESQVDEIRRIIEVNLLGQIHGVKAVLPIMKQQGSGTIINIASALAWRAVPLLSAYTASKHGIKGFTEALRLELMHDGADIDATLIVPGGINTPLFEHARSKLGVKPRPVPPVYQPSTVANAVLYASEHPRRDIVVGAGGKLLILAERISPRLTDWYMLWNDRMWRLQKTDIPDDNRDNLFEPFGGAGAIRGSFGEEAREQSIYTRIFELHPWTKIPALGVLAVGAVPLLSTAATVMAARKLVPAALSGVSRLVRRAMAME